MRGSLGKPLTAAMVTAGLALGGAGYVYSAGAAKTPQAASPHILQPAEADQPVPLTGSTTPSPSATPTGGSNGTGRSVAGPVAAAAATDAATDEPGAGGAPSDGTQAKRAAGGVGGSTLVPRTTVPPTTTGGRSPTRSPSTRSGSPSTSPTPTPPPLPCATGGHLIQIEAALVVVPGYQAVIADGVASPTDCDVIASFQRRFGITPARGQADATTAAVARRIAISSDPRRQAQCGAGAGVTACVDLSQQTMWVVRDGAVILGPTVIRSGLRGFATPTGTYPINLRNRREWSDEYLVWLPYWQRFVRGIGFHETTSYLHNGALGSHGCVNVLHADAVRLWELLNVGTTVRVFGRRPGT